MEQRFFQDSFHCRRKDLHRLLAFCFCLGLAGGSFTFLLAGKTLLPLMRSALYAPVSIVGILCVSVFPILISAYAVFLSNFLLLLSLSFARAFLFSFVSLGISQAFASAGWLMQGLLLFGGWTSLPVLYWYWLRNLSPGRRFHWGETALAFTLSGLLGSIHFGIISPFLVRLIGI